MSDLIKTDRIETLKNRMLSLPRYASIEQAKIITDTYKEHEGEPRIMQRAYSLKNALEKINISVEPEELIVGNRTAGVRYGVVFPESGSTWVDKEFETLPTRPQDKFNVNEDDIKYFRDVIYPYWQGKSLEDVLRSRYGEEIDEIAKVVKINQKDHAQGHINPDCEGWLKKGPAGLKAEAEEHYAKETDEDKKLFYKSVVTVMEGTINFIQRYRDLLNEQADENPEWADNKHFMKQLRHYGSYSLFYRWNQMHHLSHREEPIILCIHIISMILMQESRTISQYLKLSKAYGLSSMRLFI